MTRDEIQSLLITRIGNRTDLADIILLELVMAQEFVLEADPTLRPWFMFKDEQALEYAALADSSAIPTDFIEEVEGEPLRWYNSTVDAATSSPWRNLVKEDFDYARARWPGQATTPKAYTLRNNAIYLSPVPTEDMTLRMMYWQKQATLSDSVTTNGWTDNAADLLMAETGLRVVGTHMQNSDALLAAFKLLRDEAKVRLYNRIESREHTNRRYQMGDD